MKPARNRAQRSARKNLYNYADDAAQPEKRVHDRKASAEHGGYRQAKISGGIFRRRLCRNQQREVHTEVFDKGVFNIHLHRESIIQPFYLSENVKKRRIITKSVGSNGYATTL